MTFKKRETSFLDKFAMKISKLLITTLEIYYQLLFFPCRQTTNMPDHVAEGCFCPEDQILFNSYTGICVPKSKECRKFFFLCWINY